MASTDVVISQALSSSGNPVFRGLNFKIYIEFTLAFYNGHWLVYFYDPRDGETNGPETV